MANGAITGSRKRFTPLALVGVFRPRRLLRGLDLRRWPPAVQIVVLSVLLSAALAVALTWMGYSDAARGLKQQADAALSSDALVVTQAVDDWNAQRIASLQVNAAMPAVRRYAQAGTSASAAVKAPAQELLSTLASTSGTDLEAISLVAANGTVLYNSAQGTPAGALPSGGLFKAAVSGSAFASGVVLSNTGQPTMYHAVPVKDDQGKPIAVLQSRSLLTAVYQVVMNVNNRIGPNAFGILIDGHGVVIANSKDPSWAQRPLTALPKDTLDALAADARWGAQAPPPPLNQSALAQFVNTGQQQFFTWTLSGARYHAEAVASHEVPWTYVISLPEADFNASAQTFLRHAAAGAAVALAIASLLSIVFTRVLIFERRRSQEREQQLTRRVAELQVQIDEARRASDVKQIVESEFFQDLTGKARQQREQRRQHSNPPPTGPGSPSSHE